MRTIAAAGCIIMGALGTMLCESAGAHQGESAPQLANPDPSLETLSAHQCTLPPPTDPILFSYHAWITHGTSQQVCNIFWGAEDAFMVSQLPVSAGLGGSIDCPGLRFTMISGQAMVSRIEDAAQGIYYNEYDWDDLSDFIAEAKGALPPAYKERHVNVYVFDPEIFEGVEEFRGFYVRDVKGGSGDLIFMPSDAAGEVLAHELGHAFGLDHVNFWGVPEPGLLEQGRGREYCAEYDHWDGRCDYQRSNVMWAAGAHRTRFTQGQKLRAVCNTYSAINAHGDRPGGYTFTCPDWSRVSIPSDPYEDLQHPLVVCPVLHDALQPEPLP